MKKILAALAALLLIGAAHAQRIYSQAELDSMLAPIALQPDGVLSQILIAATVPQQVAEAARWSRANPHLSGDPAVRAVQNEPWDPAVKALVAFPDLLMRMDESPQWMQDLGEAFVNQEVLVMDTVQTLRQRAQAAGHLSSNDQTVVYPQGDAIVVYPRTHYVYVNYYDPYVVYGPWWWPHYRPVFWRPWAPRPVFVAHGFFYTKPDWHHKHVHVVHKPVHVHQHHVVPGKWRPHTHVVTKPFVRVPESQRKPIVQPHHAVQPHHMPAASGFSNHKRDVVRPPHAQPPQHHGQPRPQAHGQPRGEARGHAPMAQRQGANQPSRSHAGNGAGFRSQHGNGGSFRGNGGGGGFRGRG
jgi:Protein of unknown function (DUF3300)